jgi:hypothetical protein
LLSRHNTIVFTAFRYRQRRRVFNLNEWYGGVMRLNRKSGEDYLRTIGSTLRVKTLKRILAVFFVCTLHVVGEESGKVDLPLRLDALRTAHSNDVEILLGVADCRRMLPYSHLYANKKLHALEYYEDVLCVDPHNKAARCICLIYEAEKYLDVLDNARLVPEKRAAELLDELRPKEITLSNALAQAKVDDPQNAIYEYLSATMLLYEGSLDSSLDCIRKGLAKQRIDLYTPIRFEARRKVLDSIDLQLPERTYYLLERDDPPLSFFDLYFLSRIEKIVKKSDAKDKVQVEKICDLTIAIGRQMSETALLITEVLESLVTQRRGLEAKASFLSAIGDEEGKRKCEVARQTIENRIKVMGASFGNESMYLNSKSRQECNDFLKYVQEHGEFSAIERFAATINKISE